MPGGKRRGRGRSNDRGNAGHHHRGGGSRGRQGPRGDTNDDWSQMLMGGNNRDVEFPPIGGTPMPLSRGQQRGQSQQGGRGQARRSSRGRGQGLAKKSEGGENDSGSEESEMEDASVAPTKRSRQRKFDGPIFGFKRMYNFLDSDPNDILLSINKDKDDWKELLESKELTGDKLVVAIQVLGEKVCVDVPVLLQLQTNALNACCSKDFVAKLEAVVTKLMFGTTLTSRRNPHAPTEFPVDTSPLKVFTNIYEICAFIIKTMPFNGVDYFKGLIIKSIGTSSASNEFSELHIKFKTLAEQVKEIFEKTQKKEEIKQRQRYSGFNDEDMAEFDNEAPPDNFTEIEVIPTIEELRRTSEAFLRPNKTKGAYNDCDHYLDVQFRLLREDFVQPLRKGIKTFMKDRHDYLTKKKKMPLGEIRLYPFVRIIKVAKERDTVVYKLQLSEDVYKRIRWEKSKRLLVGSLIVLTTVENPFQPDNTFFGVVFTRKVPDLEKGIVSVAWESTPPRYDEDEEYSMFESEVYLEAYRHTLDTLKKLELESFPMKKFIVDANNAVEAPKYLKDATRLLEMKMADGSYKFVSHEQGAWPTAEDFGLDENQLHAFRAAVTQEFSIIQGPPGTGKTFLGLKIAETLLKNSNLWKGIEGSPITVVCYTNHALDQFLEGILRYYEREQIQADIIRIGGRCQSEALSKYSLREVRRRKKNKLPKSYYTNERNCRDEIYDEEESRSSKMNEVTGLQDLQGIVDFESLSCWSQLQVQYPEVLWKHMRDLKWLNIDDNQLVLDQLSEVLTCEAWFQVRQFPKSVVRRRNKEEKVERVNLGGDTPMDVDLEDEEDYDIDELMANRVDLEEIFLEAETSEKINMGRRLKYLPRCSVKDCEKFIRSINKSIIEATRGMNQSQTEQHRQLKRSELLILENRRKILAEVFRLFNGQLLDLPDVKELMNDIRKGNTVHFSRLRPEERWALYFAVTEKARQLIAESVADVEKRLTELQRELRDIIQFGDGLILRDCQVVGLTTTGAAKYNNLLKMMKSKIVIVEEAAEVFEAHIVTCITQACEQLIMIGDHRQLRPSPTVHDLAVRFHLDLSLFERMLNNNLHCYQLKVQHRMRPDISDLVVGTIYEELYNHESVKCYPDVKGITKNVFFISHNEKEKAETDSMSKSNVHEAKFIASLCRYLVLQGYEPDRITVLTMYTGQMFLLKKEVSRTCKGVRITCVDNFQGEENDIILLSLVRSNSEGKIGFLSIENRICVSLSRAKHGLYVIGNMEMMEEKSKTWKAIKQKLEEKEFVGDSLEIECQIHRTRALVKNDYDFNKASPEGGCTEMCDTLLDCTHKCSMVCHSIDKDHSAYRCRQPCLKRCENNLHDCKGVCSQPCPRCPVMVEKKMLNCEHIKSVPCYAKIENYTCQVFVNKQLLCGHEETMSCHVNIQDYKCKLKIPKTLPCSHSRILECYVDPASIRCKVMTAKVLPCAHSQLEECWIQPEVVKCKTIVSKKIGKCGHDANVECWEKDKPIICKGPCTTRLECGHACTKICHVDDDPGHLLYQCKKNCSRECADGHPCKGKHPCSKPCPPCKELITRALPCGHRKEKLECHVNIATYECLEACERLLNICGHMCPRLCFQPCGPCETKVWKRAPCGHDQLVICGHAAFSQNCEVLVSSPGVPLCGHRNIKVPCKNARDSPEELVKYCQRPCDHSFTPAGRAGCDHKCLGTCSKCFQGRIHMKCQSECGKQLVCGHRCEVNCSKFCPPCSKPCLMKCEHTECKKLCGEPCSKCKEQCTWKCPHARCTKLCGEVCDRDPCNEPCPKKLKCNHDCVGYCGEPCPPLCRVCDSAELTEIFFGTEDAEDARFVYLADCAHTVEAEALENYIKNFGSGMIKAKECPKCKTPIRNCRRFNNIIHSFYEDVRKVKMHSFGNRANSDKMRDECYAKVSQDNVLERVFPRVQTQIREFLVDEVPDRNGVARIVRKSINEFSMRSMEFIANSALKVSNELIGLFQKEKLTLECYNKVVTAFRKTFSYMLERQPLSRQEVMDFNAELDRIDYFKQLMLRRSMPACKNNATANKTYQTAKKYVVSSLPLTTIRKETFLRLLKELDDQLRSGLGITDRERLEIIHAMGMNQGHWFKCPNGHIYIITECGGAMSESRCNECGAAIGGANHRLRGDNALAREMDGAQRAAWPTALI